MLFIARRALSAKSPLPFFWGMISVSYTHLDVYKRQEAYILKRTALLIVVITILSKFVGFGREMVLAYFYGASSVSDAYLISMTIPTTIFAFISGAIASVFIPMYTQIEAELGVKEADKYTNNCLLYTSRCV